MRIFFKGAQEKEVQRSKMNISKVLGLLIGAYLIQGLLGKYYRRILIHQRKIVSHSKCKEHPPI